MPSSESPPEPQSNLNPRLLVVTLLLVSAWLWQRFGTFIGLVALLGTVIRYRQTIWEARAVRFVARVLAACLNRYVRFVLAVALIALLIWISPRLERARRLQALVDAAAAAHVHVAIYYENPLAEVFASRGVRGPYLRPPGPRWLHSLLGKQFFGHVTSVNLMYADDVDTVLSLLRPEDNLIFMGLNGSGADDDSVKHLAALTNLWMLHLDDTNIGDDSLKVIAGLTSLNSLSVNGTRITDAGLADLRDLRNLASLHLADTQIRDLRPLSRMPGLQWLVLRGTQVANLEPLAKLNALQQLELADTPVADLKPLAGLSGLQYLDLSGTGVSDLTPLASIRVLRSLDLSGTRVSDLTPLAKLPSLKDLKLAGTPVTDLAPLATMAVPGPSTSVIRSLPTLNR